MALGSGEALNEHVTGQRWPTRPERMARLRECVDVMRASWRGEEVTHSGQVVVDRARLWSLPDEPPQLVAGAMSVETAAWAAQWADGLITTNQPVAKLRRIVHAYRAAGGRGALRLQVHMAYAPTDNEALAIAVDQWRGNCLSTELAWDLTSPAQFEAATKHVPASELAANVRISSDLGRHLGWLREYVDLAFEELYLHHVGQRNEAFIEEFGSAVLPALR